MRKIIGSRYRLPHFVPWRTAHSAFSKENNSLSLSLPSSSVVHSLFLSLSLRFCLSRLSDSVSKGARGSKGVHRATPYLEFDSRLDSSAYIPKRESAIVSRPLARSCYLAPFPRERVFLRAHTLAGTAHKGGREGNPKNSTTDAIGE